MRFDDGTLILDEPDIVDVQRERRVLNVAAATRRWYRIRARTPFRSRCATSARHLSTGRESRAAVTDASRNASSMSSSAGPSKQSPVLEPGEQAEFTAVLVPRCDYENPTRFDEEIRFTATGLNCEPVEFQVAAEFQTPELQWDVSPSGNRRRDAPVLLVTMRNKGEATLGSREVDRKYLGWAAAC